MPKTKIANPKEIQQKSRSHEVVELLPFRKNLHGHTCDWGKYHPRSACSHVQAAVDKMFPGYTISAWSKFEDAQRQHRKFKWLGDGVIVTLRKKEA